METIEKEDVTWLNDVKKSRDICLEIMRFGVSQPQLKHIISHLALELEDRDMMIAIRNCIESNQDNDDQSSKIIHPGGDEDE